MSVKGEKRSLNLNKCFSKKGQVTIFIIVAIVIIGVIVGFFALRDTIDVRGIPSNIEPIYVNFLSCLEEDTLVGIDILESHGGYIELPEFEAGSGYMPFSSQLEFLGNPIPYWYYVSGNNVQKEQIPSRIEMEEQLGDFITDKIKGCRFDSYYEQGFEISLGSLEEGETSEESKAKVDILDNEVKVNLDMELNINRGENEEESFSIRNHEVSVKSDLGKLYESAKKVYEYEQESLFLENYGVDVLRFYAPVDGVEISCSPKIWSADSVFDKLQEAVEANTLALKSSGKKDDYFSANLENQAGIDSKINVRFLNSKNWPNGFEVAPSEGNILMASPVGNHPGMGVLGFCYVPYHFVYNMRYPVLVQLSSSESNEGEIFQFPVTIIIQGNKPREALDVSAVGSEGMEVPDLCKYKNTLIEVNTYDVKLNPVETDVSYECLGVKCDIGKTSLTKPLRGLFPQCVNGFIRAEAEGFEDSKYLYSTTSISDESESVEIVLDRLYDLNIDLKLDRRDYGREAIISFIPVNSGKKSRTIVYPEQKNINLSEGEYEVQVQVYKNSELKLPSTTTEKCIEVPQTGIAGVFGLTSEKCFDVEIPEQIISNALAGGGKEKYYILESELKDSDTIEINADSLKVPNSIEQLQENYILFEDKGLDIMFK